MASFESLILTGWNRDQQTAQVLVDKTSYYLIRVPSEIVKVDEIIAYIKNNVIQLINDKANKPDLSQYIGKEI